MERYKLFVKDERLEEQLHDHDTQMSECINMLMSLVAPTNKTFSKNSSLEFRLCQVIGINNIGAGFFSHVLVKLGIKINAFVETYLAFLDKEYDQKKSFSVSQIQRGIGNIGRIQKQDNRF